MNEKIERILSELKVDDASKDTLLAIDKLANSTMDCERDSIPSIILVSQMDCIISDFAKSYARIIDESNVLSIRGNETFLDLVFPKNNDRDEMLFYSSPQRVSSIRNRFYGTMLISFCEYEGVELLKSESLVRLLEFVKSNKGNMYFIFHVLPDFRAKAQLRARIGEIINVVEEKLGMPSLEESYEYVLLKLSLQGFEISAFACKCLKENVLPLIRANKSYVGYRSLDNLLVRVNYENAISSKEKSALIIGESVMTRLTLKYQEENVENIETQIGFRI